jgi:hypothetical protein
MVASTYQDYNLCTDLSFHNPDKDFCIPGWTSSLGTQAVHIANRYMLSVVLIEQMVEAHVIWKYQQPHAGKPVLH